MKYIITGMIFNSEDMARGYKDCECSRRFILEAGTDYPLAAWGKCVKCESFTVDMKKAQQIEDEEARKMVIV